MRQSRALSLADLEITPDDDRGHWQYADYFARIDTCFQWHIRPSEMGLCEPEEDFGVMMAYTRSTAKMRAWEGKQQEEELEKQRREAERQNHIGSKYGRRG